MLWNEVDLILLLFFSDADMHYMNSLCDVHVLSHKFDFPKESDKDASHYQDFFYMVADNLGLF